MLAIENPQEYKDIVHWHNVRVIAPPAGEVWEHAVKILGIYDNLPFGQRMMFGDNMAFLRREFVTKYMSDTGYGFREPETENRKAFRTTVSQLLQIDPTTQASKLSASFAILSKPHEVYDLVKKIIVSDVKNPDDGEWKPLGSCQTIHAFANSQTTSQLSCSRRW
jgi:hypothetical protein